MGSFEAAVLKAKVAQICNHVGYNAITQESSNILIDLYRRTIHHLARHCKEAANNNRRVEPTIIDLVQAYNFIGIPIPELEEHIETVKIPFDIPIEYDKEQLPSNRIQRNLLVDDLLEAEKSTQPEDQEDNGETRGTDESGIEEDEKSCAPLLRDAYSEIANKFPEGAPVKADKKIRLGGRILLRTKISAPVNDVPEPVPSTSKAETKPSKLKKKKEKVLKRRKKQDNVPSKKIKIEIENDQSVIKKELIEKPIIEPSSSPAPKVVKKPRGRAIKQGKGKKKRKNVSREFVPPSPTKDVSISPIEKEKVPRGTKKGRAAITPLDPSVAEPPSFLPILESAREEEVAIELKPQISHIPVVTPNRTPTPSIQPVKQSKGRRKKKEKSNQFAIETETVTATDESEWVCPACKGPDDGDLMVQCDTCEEWYHLKCTGLKKPPEDDENWDCQKCHTPKSKSQKRPQTSPVIEAPPIKVVAKTPEPPTPTVKSITKPILTAGTTQDDLCPECNLPDDGTMMIQCDDPFCAKWFHGKCVGLVDEPKEDESWFCKVCVDKQQSAFKRRRRAK